MKVRLTHFLQEIALQLQARLPDNLRILRKADALEPRSVLGGQASDSRHICEIAEIYQTLGDKGIDITALEGEWRRLLHTSIDAHNDTPITSFWSKVASLKEGNGNRLFPQLDTSHGDIAVSSCLKRNSRAFFSRR